MANGLTPDIIGSFLQGQQARQQNQLFEQQLAKQQADLNAPNQQAQVQQLTGQILSGEQQDAKLKELFTINPKAAEDALNAVGLLDQRQRDQAANFAFDLINTAPEQRTSKIQARAQSLQAQGRDPSDTLSLLNQPAEQQDTVLRTIQQAALSTKDRAKLSARQETGQDVPAGLAEFQALAAGLSPEDAEKAKRIKLGLDPRATGSAVQTIAANGIADTIAKTESVIAEGKESGKIKAKIALEPKLKADIETARAKASADGETFTELRRMEAAMPGLVDTVGQLKGLAPLVTSTLGGRAFDAVVKESGFGATKGADARAKFIATINNQVLPLLRQTFGAAFTEREGEALKKSMSDPDASPSQKVLQLESFIDQKVRNIQSKQRELDQDVTPTQEINTGTDQGKIMVDANGNRARVFADGTFEEL